MNKKTTDVENCSLCGFCKVNCPVFKATMNEASSPRGRAIQIKKDCITQDFYNCSICKACITECPASVDLDIEGCREKLVKEGKETEANKKMIENIRKYGNPFGKVEKGKIPKDLYCC